MPIKTGKAVLDSEGKAVLDSEGKAVLDDTTYVWGNQLGDLCACFQVEEYRAEFETRTGCTC